MAAATEDTDGTGDLDGPAPARTMRVCVLGTHSFTEPGPKVGTQHIAEKLAQQGHEVVYVTSHGSALMLASATHRHKYLRTFRPTPIAANLVQITPVNLFPARLLKRLESSPLERRFMQLNRRLERIRDRQFGEAEYDLCIFSAALNMTLIPKLRARHYIYRHNDLLAEFPTTPRTLLDVEETIIHGTPLRAVCCVNTQLAASIRARNPALHVTVVPNGIDLALFDAAVPDAALSRTRDTNVLYVGAFNSWVDVDLVLATAVLMPDHTFHLYGSWAVAMPRHVPANVTIHPPIAHAEVASKMKACAVGLIPYNAQNATRMVERPLKYYEYLAAGMGVVATTSAGRGLEPYAEIGDSPHALAAAIHRAKSIPARHGDAIRAEVQRRDWHDLVREIIAPAMGC